MRQKDARWIMAYQRPANDLIPLRLIARKTAIFARDVVIVCAMGTFFAIGMRIEQSMARRKRRRS